jgi:hypothetical protein
MLFNGKPVIGLMRVEKARSCCDETKIVDRCAFSAGWLRNFKELAWEGDIQVEYSFD